MPSRSRGQLASAGSSAPSPPALPTSRPYRSHKVPACQRCRSRKIRCTIDLPEQPCLLCRLQNAVCRQPLEPSESEESAESPSRKRQKRQSANDSSRNTDHNLAPEISGTYQSAHLQQPVTAAGYGTVPTYRSNGTAGNEDTTEKSPMIIGPAAAEDVQVIEEFMTSAYPSGSSRNASYHVISRDRSKPVLYHSVPAWRKGWRAASMRGSSQRDILEHILGPLAPALVTVYFESIHPWFPILDKASFVHPDGGGKSAAATYCNIYATSLLYWSTSSDLNPHPRPDITYSWNLAVAATAEDFLAPSLTTICAALLDLNGRPTSSIKGNVLTSARAVALSHTFGLNRDPTSWNLPQTEIHARIRLWWGLLIHDRWSSFAHGVPPVLVKDQYDVPLPTRESLLGDSGERTKRGTDCFLAMCELTEILGDLLPIVYRLQTKGLHDSFRTLRRVQTAIDDWEEALPDWITTPDKERDAIHGGSCSLRLSLLAVKMLICRISLRDVVKLSDLSDSATIQYHHCELRRSAQTLITFVCILERSHLEEFWLPYAAYHITSAATVLIRYAIDGADHNITNACKSSLIQLIERLQKAKDIDDWDIGDICLAQCHDPVSAITAALGMMIPSSKDSAELAATGVQSMTGNNIEYHEFGNLDFLPQFDGDLLDMQYPWATLWDMPEPPGAMLMH